MPDWAIAASAALSTLITLAAFLTTLDMIFGPYVGIESCWEALIPPTVFVGMLYVSFWWWSHA